MMSLCERNQQKLWISVFLLNEYLRDLQCLILTLTSRMYLQSKNPHGDCLDRKRKKNPKIPCGLSRDSVSTTSCSDKTVVAV